MHAIFLAGGESLELRPTHVATLRKLGQLLAPMPVLLRVGPTKGEVIGALCDGLISAPVRSAEVLVVLPDGYSREGIAAQLREIAMVVPSQKDHDHRNTDEIHDSRWVIGLFGGGKTYTEIVKAVDKRKPTVVLDGPGDALRQIRRDSDILGQIAIVSRAEDVIDFLGRPLEQLAAGS